MWMHPHSWTRLSHWKPQPKHWEQSPLFLQPDFRAGIFQISLQDLAHSRYFNKPISAAILFEWTCLNGSKRFTSRWTTCSWPPNKKPNWMTYKRLCNAGRALLDDDKKPSCANQRNHVNASPVFSNNVKNLPGKIWALIDNESDLEGLPGHRSKRETRSRRKDQPGQMADYTRLLELCFPSLTYSAKTWFARKVWCLRNRAYGDEFDNTENILKSLACAINAPPCSAMKATRIMFWNAAWLKNRKPS